MYPEPYSRDYTAEELQRIRVRSLERELECARENLKKQRSEK